MYSAWHSEKKTALPLTTTPVLGPLVMKRLGKPGTVMPR